MSPFNLKTPTTVIIFILMLPLGNASATTVDYFHCYAPVSGEWNYGRAPKACNASAFGSDDVVVQDYSVATFDDHQSVNLERDRYVREMQAIIHDAAAYYMKKRKPTVSNLELQWWIDGVTATAAHESYMSHYRRATDGQLKLMRGDLGHGHGLMQIDDRSHFDAITSGIAWNLMSHLAYAMDIYYDGWQKAPSQSCVAKETNYELRARAAWSAFNGGPNQVCRFTNSKSAWAANDKAFYASLKNKTWMNYISQPLTTASIQVSCLMEKTENCGAPPSAPVPTAPGQPLPLGVLYKSASSGYCVNTAAGSGAASAANYSCVADFRDTICLHQVASFNSSTIVALSASQDASLVPTILDRHSLCESYDSSLQPVGSSVQSKKAIYLRSSPGGAVIGVTSAGAVYTVLDFEVRNYPSNDRYYKIHLGTMDGYFYAGNKTDYATWATASSNNSSLIAVGAALAVKNSAGINMRVTPGGTLQALIPSKTRLQVLQRVISGSENSVYFKVSYAGQTGYIYSGHLLPDNSTADWVIPSL